MLMRTLLTLLSLSFRWLTWAESEDAIHSLPGLSFDPNFKHYSGYLKTARTHFLHYWFVTSQNNPNSDPLVFWFNGGPGCSSLDGLLNEMGPYQVNPDGQTLRQNRNSWNKNASIVYIESPVGVGFSYSSDGFSGFPSDDSTSTENYEAFKQFFLKFPAFRLNRVFIAGESYGGIYVPTLVGRILEGLKKFPVNLEGMAIGNGCVNQALDTDTLVRFAYGHGLVGEKEWTDIEKECCNGCFDDCDLSAQRGECRKKVEEIVTFCWEGGLNVYDLFRPCDTKSERNSIKMRAIKRGILRAKSSPNKSHRWHFGFNESGAGRNGVSMSSDGRRFYSDVPCLDDTSIINYLNIPSVRQALHIAPTEIVPDWDICNDWINMVYRMQYADVSSLVRKAVDSKLRVLLYYGDTDMACNFLQGQQFSAQLGLEPIVRKKPWHFDGQIGGFKTQYAKGLTFITVRGAGHMVPQWRGPQMDYAFGQFLANRTI
uniref:Carboxypeptidase n=1 Tax=Globodera rostochiensis TaxID=31243 RepID=A0A914HWM5_GLORO